MMGLYISSVCFFNSFFNISPFDCGYSSDEVVLLKSHAVVNYIYSADAKHGPLSENTSSATPK